MGNFSVFSNLTITAYTDSSFNTKKGSFEAQINPNKYAHKFQVKYNKDAALGASDETLKFDKVKAEIVSFELTMDATGVVSILPNDLKLQTRVEKLLAVVYDYNGSIHMPNYVKLTWGDSLDFRCKLTSININYTLFRPNGSPLRAKIDLEFEKYIDQQTAAKEAKRSSPDLTHIKTVVKGDTLPQMTHEIYGDSRYYLSVAKYNELDDFRDLKPGSQLVFPPLT